MPSAPPEPGDVADPSRPPQLFTESASLIEELKKEIEPPLNAILAKVRDNTTMADERAVARAEIEHYKEKVAKLANEGLADAKKQDKAESNQGKLKTMQDKFAKLDGDLKKALMVLDYEIANATNAAIATFISLQAAYTRNVATVYDGAQALAAAAPVQLPPPEDVEPEVAPFVMPPAPPPVIAAPVIAAPVIAAPVIAAPVIAAPVVVAPVVAAPVAAPVVEAPVAVAAPAPVAVVAEVAHVEAAPVEEAPVEAAPVEDTPVEEAMAPVEAAPVEAPVE